MRSTVFQLLLSSTLLCTSEARAVGWCLGEPALLSAFNSEDCPVTAPFLRKSFTYPKFELVDDNEMFEFTLHVPSANAQELSVSLEESVGSRRLVSVNGIREVTNEDYSTVNEFSQSIPLDASIESEEVVATLTGGVLVVSAPKHHREREQEQPSRFMNKMCYGRGRGEEHGDDMFHIETPKDMGTCFVKP